MKFREELNEYLIKDFLSIKKGQMYKIKNTGVYGKVVGKSLNIYYAEDNLRRKPVIRVDLTSNGYGFTRKFEDLEKTSFNHTE